MSTKTYKFCCPGSLRIIAFVCLLLVCSLPAFSQPAVTNFQDYLIAPLRIHLLSAKSEPRITTTLAGDDFDRILKKMNRVWSQAGITFYLESIVKEEAANANWYEQNERPPDGHGLLAFRPPASTASNMFHIYYVKEIVPNGIFLGPAIFVKDTARLRQVKDGLDEPLPRVSSHELGHALGLDHRQNTTNLMASGTTGFWLDDSEIKQAKQTAAELKWIESAPAMLKRADDQYRSNNLVAARLLYKRLAAIPINMPELELAKTRVEK
jgi:hypothetical protein